MKNARYRGHQLMRAQLRHEERASVNLDQWHKRLEQLKEPGRLFEEILSRAKVIKDNPLDFEAPEDFGDEVEDNYDAGEDLNINFGDEKADQQQGDHSDTTVPIPDGNISKTIAIDNTSSEKIDDPDDPIPYHMHMRAFLEFLLDIDARTHSEPPKIQENTNADGERSKKLLPALQ